MRNRSWPHELCITHAIHCKLIEYKQTRRQRRSQVKAFKGWQYTEYIVQSQNCICLMFSLKVMFTDKIILALMLFDIITSWVYIRRIPILWTELCCVLYCCWFWLTHLMPQALHNGVPSSASLQSGVFLVPQDAHCFPASEKNNAIHCFSEGCLKSAIKIASYVTTAAHSPLISAIYKRSYINS